MGFWNKYPYTDFHELNLDWLLNEVSTIEKRIDELHDELKQELTDELKAYVDSQISSLEDAFETLTIRFNVLDLHVSELDTAFANFTTYVNNEIAGFKRYVDDQITATNLRTDLLIASNNQFIIDTMAEQLRNMTVLNFFNGQYVTVQEMFNDLAKLHLNDAIAYNVITARGYTYGSIEALNLTYGDIVNHGNTLLP